MSDVVPEELCYELLLRVPLVPLFRFRSVCKAWRCIIDDILPEEICLVLPILVRVPAATLFRLRFVCKAWYRIINDISFVRMYLDRQEDGDNLIVRGDDMLLYMLPLSSIDCSTDFFELTHSNYLLALDGPNIRPFPVLSYGGLIMIPHHPERMTWMITNPFTRESIELPPHGYSTESFQDNSRRNGHYYSCCGIGYNSATDDFKVVSIFQFQGPDNRCMILQTLVYSLKSNYWKTIPNFRKPVYSDDGVFVNGSLHWIIWKGTASKCILAFDLSTEKELVFRCPPLLLAVDFRELTLHVLGGCLCLKDSRAIWMMKDYGHNLWIELVSSEQLSYIGRPLAFIKRKNQVIFQHSNKELLFDIEKKCAKKVHLLDSDWFTSQVIPSSIFRPNRMLTA